MYSLDMLLIVGVTSAVAGIIIGYLLSKLQTSGNTAKRQLEEQLQKQEQQQQDYQKEVTEHFSETAQLLNQLTSSYQDVHQHLAKGAQLLTGDLENPVLISLNKIDEAESVIEGVAITPEEQSPKETDPDHLEEKATTDNDTIAGDDAETKSAATEDTSPANPEHNGEANDENAEAKPSSSTAN